MSLARSSKSRLLCLALIFLLCRVSVAQSEECKEATKLQLGQPAPCDGILIPPDMGRDMLLLKDQAQLFEEELLACDRQLELCMQDVEELSEPSLSPLIWAIVGGVVMLAAGVGIGVVVGITLDR